MPDLADWPALETKGFPATIGPIRRQGDRFALLLDERHVNSRDQVHGGLLMGFADQAMGWFAVEQADDGKTCATIQLDSHFAGTAAIGSLLVLDAEVRKATRNFLFLSGRIQEGERLVASFHGIWKIINL